MGFAATANLPPWMHGLPSARRATAARPAALYGALRRPDRILLLLLHLRGVQFRGHGQENLRKYGGFIPGIRPGRRTAEYLDFVLTRLTVIGAMYIAIVCLLPESADRVSTTCPSIWAGPRS